MEQLKEILELVVQILTLLASPAVIAIITWIYSRTKKKENAEQFQKTINEILATVKAAEKELAPKNGSQNDPRMDRALELFEEAKRDPRTRLIAKKLHLDLDSVNPNDVQDIFEKVLHAKKIGFDFDAVKELLLRSKK